MDEALTLTADSLRPGTLAATPYCVDGERLRVLESTADGPALMVYRR